MVLPILWIFIPCFRQLKYLRNWFTEGILRFVFTFTNCFCDMWPQDFRSKLLEIDQDNNPLINLCLVFKLQYSLIILMIMCRTIRQSLHVGRPIISNRFLNEFSPFSIRARIINCVRGPTFFGLTHFRCAESSFLSTSFKSDSKFSLLFLVFHAVAPSRSHYSMEIRFVHGSPLYSSQFETSNF